MECWIILTFHKRSNHSAHTDEICVWFATQNFMDKELFILWLLVVLVIWWFKIVWFLKGACGIAFKIINTACVEPEFLGINCISIVRSIHVCIWHCDWNHEIDIKVVDDVSDETHHYNEACVFEIGNLDVHCSEFNSPSNFWILSWWWFESKRIPVGGLDIFKMHSDLVIIDLVFHKFTFVSWYWISGE